MAFFWNNLKRPWKSGLPWVFAVVMLWCCICSFRICVTMAQSNKKNSLCPVILASLLRESVVPAALVFFYERDKHLLQTGTHSSLYGTPNRHQTRAHCCLTGCSMDYQRQLPASALTYCTLWSGHAFHSFVISDMLFEGKNSFLD